MKTAMQEFIDKIQYSIDVQSGVSLTETQVNTLKTVMLVAEELLETERKQHETTFHRGINIGAFNPDMDIEGRKESSKHYYDSTFGQLDNEKKGRIQDISIG
jgi:peptide deformylase